MEAIDQFRKVIQKASNESVEAWKRSGGKVVGYVCTNVPEEILIAAGALPYRLRAPESRETSDADRHTTYLNCTYCRHLIDEALKGQFAFLDGYVGTNGCDQMRRVCDVIRADVFRDAASRKEFFLEYVAAPRVPFEETSLAYYKDELARLVRGLENHFGVSITDEKLSEAIRLVNRSRHLLHRLYELRKAPLPPLTGAETLAVTVASTCMPKEQFIRELEGLLASLRDRVVVPAPRKRVFLYGSELDNPEWVEVLESQGALVVADGLCFGARMFWDLVDETGDPLEAIARRYYFRWPCPRVMDPKGRQDRIRQILRDWKADAIVGERLVMCQLWGAERVLTDLDARETGVPTLWLEREYLLGGVGQMKTRVQAFLESLE